MFNYNTLIDFISSIADTKQDTPKQRQEHRFLIYIGIAMSMGGIVWGSITLYFGLSKQSIVPYAYTIITISNFIYLYYSKNFHLAQTIQVIISLLIPFVFQFVLGGFIASGAVIIWSILTILVSFTFQKKDLALRWFYVYVILIITSGIFDENVRQYAQHVNTNTNISILFFTLNITMVSIIIFILFFYFINSNETLQEELSLVANTDLLTNIPNRRHFFTNAKKEFIRAKRHNCNFSLLMLDIDFFKSFNDKYGHDIGDKVLVQFATLLRTNVREIDLLCRYGGEEFIILMPETKIDDAVISAQRIIDNCDLINIDQDIPRITTSIGISQFNKEDKNTESIIKRADKALYKAKENGRNQLAVA